MSFANPLMGHKRGLSKALLENGELPTCKASAKPAKRAAKVGALVRAALEPHSESNDE